MAEVTLTYQSRPGYQLPPAFLNTYLLKPPIPHPYPKFSLSYGIGCPFPKMTFPMPFSHFGYQFSLWGLLAAVPGSPTFPLFSPPPSLHRAQDHVHSGLS